MENMTSNDRVQTAVCVYTALSFLSYFDLFLSQFMSVEVEPLFSQWKQPATRKREYKNEKRISG